MVLVLISLRMMECMQGNFKMILMSFFSQTLDNFFRYFTHYTGKGRYSVKCQVIGDSDTQVNEGFINSKQVLKE